MTVPGSNAEKSLDKSSLSYHLMGASVGANGVMPQQVHSNAVCGPCLYKWSGGTLECVQTCSQFHCLGPPWAPVCTGGTYNVSCPPYLCWPH
jgi:hypothetical protein